MATAGQTDSTVVLPPTPILRWAGSKRKLLPELSIYWKPTFKRYVEPFAGSSCLFFKIHPAAAVLSDKNWELIETYEVLRDSPEILHARVTEYPTTEEFYYQLRAAKVSRLSAVNRAARFIFLNRFCFNGIFRTNASGKFNVPFSPTKTGRVPDLASFKSCADALQNAVLRACDFGTTLRNVRAGDFVYLDPPYAVSSRRVFREYGAKTFSPKDLDRLANHLASIAERGATFLLSYADCRESRALLEQWGGKRVRVKRNVAGFAGARRFAIELIITNCE